jgi:RNAse (barnase) inhibitor barstar
MDSLIIEIDGQGFSTLDGFFETIWPLLAGEPCKSTINLDAFNDILSWPETPFTLVWKDSELSQKRLGHSEIARKLEGMLSVCHPSNRESLLQRIEDAKNGRGPTMFDWLVQIIMENKSHVTLRLV